MTPRPATVRSGQLGCSARSRRSASSGHAVGPRPPARWREERGFTLSEMILVSVFVVGLIVIAVNSARGIEDENRRSNCQTELRNLKMAVAEAHAETGRYPESIEALVSAGKVELGDVDAWELRFESPDRAPDYRPVAGRC